MKFSFALICALFLFQLTSQGQSFPEQLTEDHQLIPGMNIYMVPPASYVLSPSFKGFQDPGNPYSIILLMKIPGPISKTTAGFNAERLETEGMLLKDKKAITIGPYEGYLMQVDQVADSNGNVFSKYFLIYGDESTTVLINGIYLQEDTERGKLIEQSILSTYVDTELTADPRAALLYDLDETLGGLQFHSVIGNGMLFNRDLKTPTESPDKAALIVDQSFAEMEITEREAFCLQRLAQYSDPYILDEKKGKGIKPVIIDGLSGYELHATKVGDESEALYQVILFVDEGGYFIFNGIYQTDFPEAYQDIRSIIMSFHQK